jgi:hypothetical protein
MIILFESVFYYQLEPEPINDLDLKMDILPDLAQQVKELR